MDNMAARMFTHQELMTCPYCGSEYVSVGNTYSFSSGRVFGMEVRGDVIVLPCKGECGHVWVLALGFHKGNTYWKVILNEQENEAV